MEVDKNAWALVQKAKNIKDGFTHPLFTVREIEGRFSL
jgi:hypothetical protein